MPGAATAVTTYLFDLQRTGSNRSETRLTPAALRGGGFGRDMGFSPQLEGQVYNQPLYVPGLMVGGAAHDVLFVATEANAVFALDALTGATLWRTNLGTPTPRNAQSCGNIMPSIGVTSTPVIDLATRTLYVVSFNSDGGVRFRINALDLTTGMQRGGYPADISPPAVGGSSFDVRTTGQRGAIAFREGKVYVPFGGLFGDCGIYHGWVVAIDAANPMQQSAFATPGRGSGIWAPGGFAMDAQGNAYAATGNSTPLGGHTAGSLGEFVLKIGTGAAGPSFAMNDNTAFFSPENAVMLDRADLDIGSVSPVLLPPIGGARRLLQGGKDGRVFLLDADNLGGAGNGLFVMSLTTGGQFGALGAWSNGNEVYGFVPARGTRAMCGGSNGVMALRVTANNYSVAWCTGSISGANPPVVSSNGNTDAVLWVVGTGILRAYEVATGMEVYANTEPPSGTRQWVPPVVADGRVYVTTSTSVLLYRMR
jgi:outer membrane protein assembly factor BamB